MVAAWTIVDFDRSSRSRTRRRMRSQLSKTRLQHPAYGLTATSGGLRSIRSGARSSREEVEILTRSRRWSNAGLRRCILTSLSANAGERPGAHGGLR